MSTNDNWRKSTHSQASGGNCVEVAGNGGVLVRDTQDRAGTTLSVPVTSWQQFLASVR